jgi:hypothetical protein
VSRGPAVVRQCQPLVIVSMLQHIRRCAARIPQSGVNAAQLTSSVVVLVTVTPLALTLPINKHDA